MDVPVLNGRACIGVDGANLVKVLNEVRTSTCHGEFLPWLPSLHKYAFV